MKYNKLPISISDQIEKLKNRGLRFQNEKLAHNYFANISYYRFRAYTYPFQNNLIDTQPFNKGVSFEQIMDLYLFDRKLRLLIFDSIEKIEIALRTQIIYHFALSHGSHWHLKPELYRDAMRFANHLDSLQKEIDRSNETFISHYKTKYTSPTEPPCWMGLEVSSIGLLSKIFQNLKKGEEKYAIVAHFGLQNISIIENWMLCFSTLRNICAHHGRVWNRRLIPIKIPRNTNKDFLKNTSIYTNKLYATLSCIEYILKQINLDSTFSEQLKELMKNRPFAQKKEMGFPNDWLAETLWK